MIINPDGSLVLYLTRDEARAFGAEKEGFYEIHAGPMDTWEGRLSKPVFNALISATARALFDPSEDESPDP